MPRKSRAVPEFNFDGLTDSVTNLVGSLILLVVLVIAVTQPKRSGTTELPVPENTAVAQRPMDPLLQEMRAVRERLEGVEQDIQQMEARVPELEIEIRSLAESARGPTG